MSLSVNPGNRQAAVYRASFEQDSLAISDSAEQDQDKENAAPGATPQIENIQAQALATANRSSNFREPLRLKTAGWKPSPLVTIGHLSELPGAKNTEHRLKDSSDLRPRSHSLPELPSMTALRVFTSPQSLAACLKRRNSQEEIVSPITPIRDSSTCSSLSTSPVTPASLQQPLAQFADGEDDIAAFLIDHNVEESKKYQNLLDRNEKASQVSSKIQDIPAESYKTRRPVRRSLLEDFNTAVNPKQVNASHNQVNQVFKMAVLRYIAARDRV